MKIPTLIVNLKRRIDRKNELTEGLPSILQYRFSSDLGFDFDGSDLTFEELKKYRLFDWKINSNNIWWGRDLKLGEIGCTLSHIHLWKLALNEKLPLVLVLEDDVKFIDNFDSIISKYVNFLYTHDPNWDLFYLGRYRLTQDIIKINSFMVIPEYSHCTYAYMLSRQGLCKVIDANLDSNIIPVDEFLPALYIDHPRADIKRIFKKCLRAYALDKDIVFQKDKNIAGSDTENTKFINDDYKRITNYS